MKTKKNLKDFLREEDWKTIKKSLLISSLWLVMGFWTSFISTAEAWVTNTHSSWDNANSHSSTHTNHSNHSSY